jgi:hypothetical protein
MRKKSFILIVTLTTVRDDRLGRTLARSEYKLVRYDNDVTVL